MGSEVSRNLTPGGNRICPECEEMMHPGEQHDHGVLTGQVRVPPRTGRARDGGNLGGPRKNKNKAVGR